MSKGTLTAIALLLAGAVGATYLVKPELFGLAPTDAVAQTDAKSEKKTKKKAKKKVKKNAFDGMTLVTTSDWADPTAKRDALSQAIIELVGATPTEADVNDFSHKKENLMLMAQWVIAQAEVDALQDNLKRRAEREQNCKKLQEQLKTELARIPDGVEPTGRVAWNLKNLRAKVKKAEGECAADYMMSEAMLNPKAATMMQMIVADAEWLEQFAFSGECVRPGMAISILVKIAEKHGDFFEDRMVRDIATATALEYAKSGWNMEDAVDRATFYIESYHDGRLNSVFDDLPFWQRRMVCGCKGDNAYGSVASLEWSLENVHIPADQYPGSCWRCAYRLNNIYGDSIHGPLYYAPWEAAYPENRTALTYYVGGVCGSLSHFGAFSALANGVPALTAGEPGHCAYIVLVDKKWTPAYSLSWDRGLHWQVFRNVHSYSSLHSATELYSEEQKEKRIASDALRVVAGVCAQQGKKDNAVACFEASLKAQPRNFMAWREWWTVLGANGTPDDWSKFNETLCKYLVPLYPEMAYEVMQKGALETMAKGVDKRRLRVLALDFWRACDTMGPDRWHIERLADAQMKHLGISANTPDELCSFYSDVLTSTSGSSQYMSVIIGWGNNVSSKLKGDNRAKFMEAMVKGIQRGKGMSADDRDKLLAPALLAAEKSRDMNTFQAIGNMLSDKYKKPAAKLPAHEPFPGKLASQGGLVWTSSTSNWDNPCAHWGLLEPCGGTFHTGKDTDAYLAVQLPRQVNVTGVVIITPDGNHQRMNNMKIQVSEDGENWTDVHQFGPCKQRVMRADLGGKLPLAKYVRILRPGGPDFFHLNAVFVYGNQAA